MLLQVSKKKKKSSQQNGNFQDVFQSHSLEQGFCSFCLSQWSPTFLAPGIDFTEDSFYTDQGWRQGNGFSMIQAHYILHVISNLMLLLI